MHLNPPDQIRVGIHFLHENTMMFARVAGPGKQPIRVRLSRNALTDSELKRKKVRIMC
jgi:hypothetical protein